MAFAAGVYGLKTMPSVASEGEPIGAEDGRWASESSSSPGSVSEDSEMSTKSCMLMSS